AEQSTAAVYRRIVLPVTIAGVLALGVSLRFYAIGEHFSHIDDIVSIAGPYMVKQGQPFVVSVPGSRGALSVTIDAHRIKTNPLLYAAYITTTTYAPLQFAAYPLFLSGEYGYREFLLRGRLPSAICLALALLFF